MSFYSDSFDGQWMAETTVIEELVPHIDATYRTIANRDGRAIQGMSMGGFGALKLAFKYPDLFSSVVAFAGGYRSAVVGNDSIRPENARLPADSV
jgi:endo-1,4-beta-xylanase